MPSEIQSFVDRYVERARPLSRAQAEASWKFATTGLPEHQREVARLGAEGIRLHRDAEAYRKLREWDRSDAARGDALPARQVRLLHLGHAEYQGPQDLLEKIVNLSVEISGVFNNFRGSYGGKSRNDNELTGVLIASKDSGECRTAWEAMKQIGAETGDKIRELARLRNRVARGLGYADHHVMALTLQELPPDRLFAIFDRLERDTREPYRRAKAHLDRDRAARFGIPVTSLRPWHYGDPFCQHPPSFSEFDLDALFTRADLVDLTTRHYDGLGLEIRDILARSDLLPREGKSQHAFCTHIDRAGDVRVLCNLAPTKRWATTMLHEYGHAVYDKYIPDSLPWLLREPPHILSTEAIAQLMGRHTEDPRWLKEVAALPASQVDPACHALETYQRMDQLLFARWTFVVVNFEKALYADPEQDLDTLWWDLVERYQEIPRPEGRRNPDWAAKIHIATSPVYYQNYLLGECMASQLQHAVGALGHGGTYVNNAKAGRFLVDALFRLGGTADWDETLKRATGEALNTDHFVRQYARTPSGSSPGGADV